MVTYRETKQKFNPQAAVCPECHSTRHVCKQGIYICTNCGTIIYDPREKKHRRKGVKSQSRDGLSHNSTFEASVGDELYAMKEVGDIKDYDTEYQVCVPIYDSNGIEVDHFTHKIDFRVHDLDGSFRLIEAKGIDTDDWKWRKRLFLDAWMPEHLDHEYIVRRMNFSRRER